MAVARRVETKKLPTPAHGPAREAEVRAGETRLSLFCERAIEAGWLVAVVLSPLFFDIFSSRIFEPDKAAALRLVLLAMLLAWGVRQIELRRSLRDLAAGGRALLDRNPIALAALAFLAVYLLATILSVQPELSLWGSYQRTQGFWMMLCYAGLFFFAVGYLRTWGQVDRLITVALVTSAVAADYSFIQHLGWDPLPWTTSVNQRPSATLGNPIFLSAYLLMLVPFALARLVRAAADLRRERQSAPLPPGESPVVYWSLRARRVLLYGLLLLAQLLAIFFTESRGPWLGTAFALALFALLLPLRWRRWRWFGISAAVVAVGLVFFIGINVSGSPLEPAKRASPYLQRLGSVFAADEGTVKVRRLIWFGDSQGSGAIGQITASPWHALIGWGPETMHITYPPFYPPELAHIESRTALPDRSHNDFLDMAITTGFVGLAAYLALLVTFFLVAVRLLWRTPGFGMQLFLLALITAVAGHLLELVSGIAIVATRVHLWLFLALAVVAARRLSRLPDPAAAAPEVPVAAAAPTRERRGSDRAAARRSGKRREERRRVATEDTGRRLTGAQIALLLYLGAMALAAALFFLAGRLGGTEATNGLLSALGAGNPVLVGLMLGGWVLLGMLLAALVLPARFQPGTLLRRGSWPLYALFGAVALVIAVRPILGPVIGDIYYKQGQNADGAGRVDIAPSRYVEALRWQPEQDFYWLFMGRAILGLAQAVPEGPAALPAPSAQDILNRDWSGPPAGAKRDDLFNYALAALQEARRLAPLNTDHYANLARTYKIQADNARDPTRRSQLQNEAIAWYEKAVAMSPHSALLYDELGGAYAAADRAGDAERAYQQAISLDPEYPPAIVHFAAFYVAKGQLDKGLPLYEQAIALQPAEPNNYVALASALNGAGRRDEALATLQLGLAKVSDADQKALQGLLNQLQSAR